MLVEGCVTRSGKAGEPRSVEVTHGGELRASLSATPSVQSEITSVKIRDRLVEAAAREYDSRPLNRSQLRA